MRSLRSVSINVPGERIFHACCGCSYPVDRAGLALIQKSITPDPGTTNVRIRTFETFIRASSARRIRRHPNHQLAEVLPREQTDECGRRVVQTIDDVLAE